jgi:signal transduction histidine kinase
MLATAEERQRLARELHDRVKQQVFAISMHLGAVRLALPPDAGQAHELLHAAQGMIQATHAELASLIFALQPVDVPARGLAEGLAELAAGWRTRSTTAITCSATAIPAVPVAVEHTLVRVAQEAVVNALRHSAAHQVMIAVRGDGDTVTLTIVDDGVGFDPHGPHRGLGLVSMHTRMRDIGGTLTIHSAPSHGTTIVARWQPQAAA